MGHVRTKTVKKSAQGHHWEVLYQAHPWFPHQQTRVRGCSCHPIKEAEEPDCRIRHSSHEEDHQGTSERNQHQIARGGTRTSWQLRASCLCSRMYHWGWCHHRRHVEGARLPRSPQLAEGRSQQVLSSWVKNRVKIVINRMLFGELILVFDLFR